MEWKYTSCRGVFDGAEDHKVLWPSSLRRPWLAGLGNEGSVGGMLNTEGFPPTIWNVALNSMQEVSARLGAGIQRSLGVPVAEILPGSQREESQSWPSLRINATYLGDMSLL